jgi:hypothetical protein
MCNIKIRTSILEQITVPDFAAVCKHLPSPDRVYTIYSFYNQGTNGWHWMQYKRSVTEKTLVSWTTRSSNCLMYILAQQWNEEKIFSSHHVLAQSFCQQVMLQSPQKHVKWGQWRRHGEDWGGHVPPSSLQGQFSNLSKCGEKNGGGGTFVTSVQLFRSNLTVWIKTGIKRSSLYFWQKIVSYMRYLPLAYCRQWLRPPKVNILTNAEICIWGRYVN